jgi:hypothetical protein
MERFALDKKPLIATLSCGQEIPFDVERSYVGVSGHATPRTARMTGAAPAAVQQPCAFHANVSDKLETSLTNMYLARSR